MGPPSYKWVYKPWNNPYSLVSYIFHKATEIRQLSYLRGPILYIFISFPISLRRSRDQGPGTGPSLEPPHGRPVRAVHRPGVGRRLEENQGKIVEHMGKLWKSGRTAWKNHGTHWKTMEKWKNRLKKSWNTWENYGKIKENPWEKHRTYMA